MRLVTLNHDSLTNRVSWYSVNISWGEDYKSKPTFVVNFLSYTNLRQAFPKLEPLRSIHSVSFPVQVLWGQWDECYVPIQMIRTLSVQDASYLDHHCYEIISSIRNHIENELKADAERIQAEDAAAAHTDNSDF